jgi:hypothetical protein
MIREVGNMWTIFQKTDLLLVTTNSTIRSGRLVMGVGAAEQAALIYPTLPEWAATKISRLEDSHRYGLLLPDANSPSKKLGLFQVKMNPRDPALLELIKLSTMMLIRECKKNPTRRIDMNFPGIGYGKLSPSEVLSIISSLPDNVHVWEYPNQLKGSR